MPPVLTQARGLEFRQNAMSGWGRRPQLETWRDGAYSCLILFVSSGRCFRKAETARRIPRYIESTSGGAWAKFRELLPPLRKFGRPSTTADKGGVEVLGGVWVVTGKWCRHRLQTLWVTAPDFVFMTGGPVGPRSSAFNNSENVCPLQKSRIDILLRATLGALPRLPP